MRLSNNGGCQLNQLTKTGAGCLDFASASETTPCLFDFVGHISTRLLDRECFHIGIDYSLWPWCMGTAMKYMFV